MAAVTQPACLAPPLPTPGYMAPPSVFLAPAIRVPSKRFPEALPWTPKVRQIRGMGAGKGRAQPAQAEPPSLTHQHSGLAGVSSGPNAPPTGAGCKRSAEQGATCWPASHEAQRMSGDFSGLFPQAGRGSAGTPAFQCHGTPRCAFECEACAYT